MSTLDTVAAEIAKELIKEGMTKEEADKKAWAWISRILKFAT